MFEFLFQGVVFGKEEAGVDVGVVGEAIDELGHETAHSDASPGSIVGAVDVKEDVGTDDEVELGDEGFAVLVETTGGDGVSTGDFLHDAFVQGAAVFGGFLHDGVADALELDDLGGGAADVSAFLCDEGDGDGALVIAEAVCHEGGEFGLAVAAGAEVDVEGLVLSDGAADQAGGQVVPHVSM